MRSSELKMMLQHGGLPPLQTGEQGRFNSHKTAAVWPLPAAMQQTRQSRAALGLQWLWPPRDPRPSPMPDSNVGEAVRAHTCQCSR